MVNLFDAFAEFLAGHPDLSYAEKNNISLCLKNLLDADPEKEMMRRALEHYANVYNWPYRAQSAEGKMVLGMKAAEAVALARDALALGDVALKSCLLSMYDDKNRLAENRLDRDYSDKPSFDRGGDIETSGKFQENKSNRKTVINASLRICN
tara:strand:+ start:546 stop:1001 length:456 start_codon:yes stop_codon:yes gene_type:complete